MKGDRLVHVHPDDDVSLALTHMIVHEYSQMPVRAEPVDNSSVPIQLQGVVTWKSITRSLLSDFGGQLPLCRDACDPPERFQQFSVDRPVVDVVGALFENDFILTYDKDGSFFGIMTSADLVRWTDQHAMGLVEVRRLELRLRELCCAFANNKGTPPEKMNFGYYKRKLVAEKKTWTRMVKSGPWQGVSHEEFRSLFMEATKARNAIFHFECDDRPQEYLDYRRKLADLVKLLDFGGSERPR
ncbi:MAG: hypothetical protein F4176_00720 [Acidimicrobiia bacterium]|nr:hypothetical protein [Acidimicrobiia bacterium]